jgi:hypothetical protein
MSTDEKNCCLKAIHSTDEEIFSSLAPSLIDRSSIDPSPGTR